MTVETHQIAARLAAASEVFPIAQADGWDARAYVSAEGDVLTIAVTERLGRARREYRAVIEHVAADP